MTNRSLVLEIQEYFHRHFRGETPELCCIWWAQATYEVLHSHGRKVCVQGGTALWEVGDGTEYTGYEWDEKYCFAALMEGRLPQMHAWVADIERVEIWDVTTGFQMENARKAGIDVYRDLPPHFVGGAEDAQRLGAIYEPSVSASMLAMCISKAIPCGSGEVSSLVVINAWHSAMQAAKSGPTRMIYGDGREVAVR